MVESEAEAAAFFQRTPLWLAGHLPLKGDQLASLLSPISNTAEKARGRKLPFSPPVGEMAGKPEGGAFTAVLHFREAS